MTLLVGETTDPFRYGSNVVTYTTELVPDQVLERYRELLKQQGWSLAEERTDDGYQRHVNFEPDQPIAPDMITLELQILRQERDALLFEVRTYLAEGE